MIPPLLVSYRAAGGAAEIVLRRPERRNALSRALMRDLLAAFSRARSDPAVRALILSGEGPAFCAGMDLKEMAEARRGRAGEARARAAYRRDAARYRAILEAILENPRPVIAAINGAAVAGGAGIALACDVILAADDARIGLPEVKRGLIAGILEPMLAHRFGAGLAGYLLLTGRVLDAAEALRRGLFHEVVPGGRLLDRAREVTAELAEGAPGALAEVKRFLLSLPGRTLAAQMRAGEKRSARARAKPEAREGLRAFLEKRSPEWLRGAREES